MALTALFVSYFLLLFGVLLLKIRSRDFFELLPSLFWAIMIVGPYFIARQTLGGIFPDSYQIYGVLGIGIALLIADGWEARRVQLVGAMPSSALTLTAHCLFIIFGSLEVIHLAELENNIHLLFWIRGETPGYFHQPYLLLWYKAILMLGIPLTIAVLLRARSHLMAVIFYFLSLFYACNISWEMGAVVFVLGLLLLTQELARNYSRRIWGAFTLVVLAPLIIWWLVLDKSDVSALNTRISTDKLEALKAEEVYKPNNFLALTQGDHYRLLKTQPEFAQLSSASKAYNDVLAEIFLFPVERSSWWYYYFPKIEGAAPREAMGDLFIGQMDLLEPANRVGIWALARRFNTYPETTLVSASVDADAYARWGVTGLVLAILAVFVLRWIIKTFRIRSPWGDSLNLVVLFLFAVALPRASGIAALGQYGVGAGILLMGIHYLLCRNYLKEDYLPSSRSFDTSLDRF